ncbi:MAG: hypothetical protein NTX86_06080 [Candidatus Dependentiae bacterium]|nr:hypothetical protein [Candidatus Dependentiae bacterium]
MKLNSIFISLITITLFCHASAMTQITKEETVTQEGFKEIQYTRKTKTETSTLYLNCSRWITGPNTGRTYCFSQEFFEDYNRPMKYLDHNASSYDYLERKYAAQQAKKSSEKSIP